jgi:uncharacterized protein YjbI with pentapeptide repeats
MRLPWLTNAELSYVNLEGSLLYKPDFSSANRSGSNLNNIRISAGQFDFGKLRDARMANAVFEACSFVSSDLMSGPQFAGE